jgi:hypothetical protein
MLAHHITRLAEDDVELDEIEQLLIALQRSGHLSRAEWSNSRRIICAKLGRDVRFVWRTLRRKVTCVILPWKKILTSFGGLSMPCS